MSQKFKLIKGNEVKMTKSKALVDLLRKQGWSVDGESGRSPKVKTAPKGE